MSWTLYRWVWRIRSPVHLGISPAGSLARTRLYVPARTLWGALTAELTRARADDRTLTSEDYIQMGEWLQKSTRFSYLYPAQKIGDEWVAWLPQYHDRDGEKEKTGLVWQREDGGLALGDREFRTCLLGTHASTAINPYSDTAEEGTLRETETILPQWRNSRHKHPDGPVAFVGYVFCRDESLWQNLCEIKEIWVGGDSRYGFGCLSQEETTSVSSFWGREINVGEGNPVVKTSVLLAHSIVTNENQAFKGSMEVLQQYDRGAIRISGIAWTPGTKVSGDTDFDFELFPSGLWNIRRG